MEVYHTPFEDGEFLLALHNKLSSMHEYEDESTYPTIKTSEIDFHSKLGDLSLELDDNTTPPKSPSLVPDDESPQRATSAADASFDLSSSSSGSSVFRAPKTNIKSSPLQSSNEVVTDFTSLSTTKPLYDESPSASTKLLEEYNSSIFASWPSSLSNFAREEKSIDTINNTNIVELDNGESCNPPDTRLHLDLDKHNPALKEIQSHSVPDSHTISLASLDDMLSKYKRKYDTHLQALRQRVTLTDNSNQIPLATVKEASSQVIPDTGALNEHVIETPRSPFSEFMDSMKKIESAYDGKEVARPEFSFNQPSFHNVSSPQPTHETHPDQASQDQIFQQADFLLQSQSQSLPQPQPQPHQLLQSPHPPQPPQQLQQAQQPHHPQPSQQSQQPQQPQQPPLQQPLHQPQQSSPQQPLPPKSQSPTHQAHPDQVSQRQSQLPSQQGQEHAQSQQSRSQPLQQYPPQRPSQLPWSWSQPQPLQSHPLLQQPQTQHATHQTTLPQPLQAQYPSQSRTFPSETEQAYTPLHRPQSPNHPEPHEMSPRTPSYSDYFGDRDSEYSLTPATPSDVLNTSDAATPTQLPPSQREVAREYAATTPELSSSQRRAAHEKEIEQIMLLNPYQQGIPALHTTYSNTSLSLRAYLQNSHEDSSTLTSESESTYDKSHSDEPPSPFSSHFAVPQPNPPPATKNSPPKSYDLESQSDEPSPFSSHLNQELNVPSTPRNDGPLNNAYPTKLHANLHGNPHPTNPHSKPLPTTFHSVSSRPADPRPNIPSTDPQSTDAYSSTNNESSEGEGDEEEEEEEEGRGGKATSFWVPFTGEKFTQEQLRKYQMLKLKLAKKETALKQKIAKLRDPSKTQAKEREKEQQKLAQRHQMEAQRRQQEEMVRAEQERKEISRLEHVQLRQMQQQQQKARKEEQQRQKKIQQKKREEKRQQVLQQHLHPQPPPIYHHPPTHYQSPTHHQRHAPSFTPSTFPPSAQPQKTRTHTYASAPRQHGIRNPSPSRAAAHPKKATPAKPKTAHLKSKPSTPTKSKPTSSSSSKSAKPTPTKTTKSTKSTPSHHRPPPANGLFPLSQDDQSTLESPPSHFLPSNHSREQYPTIDYSTIPPAPAPFDAYFSSLETHASPTDFQPKYFKLPLYSQPYPLPTTPSPPQSHFNNENNIAGQHYDQPTFPLQFTYNNENAPPYSNPHPQEDGFRHPRPPLYPRSKQVHFPSHSPPLYRGPGSSPPLQPLQPLYSPSEHHPAPLYHHEEYQPEASHPFYKDSDYLHGTAPPHEQRHSPPTHYKNSDKRHPPAPAQPIEIQHSPPQPLYNQEGYANATPHPHHQNSDNRSSSDIRSSSDYRNSDNRRPSDYQNYDNRRSSAPAQHPPEYQHTAQQPAQSRYSNQDYPPPLQPLYRPSDHEFTTHYQQLDHEFTPPYQSSDHESTLHYQEHPQRALSPQFFQSHPVPPKITKHELPRDRSTSCKVPGQSHSDVATPHQSQRAPSPQYSQTHPIPPRPANYEFPRDQFTSGKSSLAGYDVEVQPQQRAPSPQYSQTHPIPPKSPNFGYDQFASSKSPHAGQSLSDVVTPVRFAKPDNAHREDPFASLFKPTEDYERSSPDMATLEWTDFLNREYGGLPSARKEADSAVMSKENNRKACVLKLLTYARIPPDHVVPSQEEKTMLRDLIPDHPEFEACVNLLKSENLFSQLTGVRYNCTKALKIYNHRQHRLVQALENYNNIDGENVKLLFYWSNDHQHLADVALRGFGGKGDKTESDHSSLDSSDFAALQEWLVFGDAISTAKKASEIFEYQPPTPTRQTWRALAVMVKTGKIYRHPKRQTIYEFANTNEYLELIREGFDTVEFEDERSGLRMFVCFSAFRCIPIYLLQFDQQFM